MTYDKLNQTTATYNDRLFKVNYTFVQKYPTMKALIAGVGSTWVGGDMLQRRQEQGST